MKQTVNFSAFCDAFEAHGRADNFSYAGLRALFDYLEQFEEETDEELELDVIALCCDYSEIEIIHVERETGCKSLSELQAKTFTIEVDDENVIYCAF